MTQNAPSSPASPALVVSEALEAMHRRLGEEWRAVEVEAFVWALGDGAGRLPSAPDLRRRFYETERRLDDLGRSETPKLTPAALAEAVAAHEAVWREIAARWQRRPIRRAA